MCYKRRKLGAHLHLEKNDLRTHLHACFWKFSRIICTKIAATARVRVRSHAGTLKVCLFLLLLLIWKLKVRTSTVCLLRCDDGRAIKIAWFAMGPLSNGKSGPPELKGTWGLESFYATLYSKNQISTPKIAYFTILTPKIPHSSQHLYFFIL